MASFVGCSFLDAGGLVWWAGNGEFVAVGGKKGSWGGGGGGSSSSTGIDICEA